MNRRSLIAASASVLLAGCSSLINGESASEPSSKTETAEPTTTSTKATGGGQTTDCADDESGVMYGFFQVYNTTNSGVTPEILIRSPSDEVVFDQPVEINTAGDITTIYETADAGTFEVVCVYAGDEQRGELDVVEGTSRAMTITIQNTEPNVTFETSVRDPPTTDC